MLGSKTYHYGWIIILTGVGILFSCLGLGRFALGMLLPSMGASLELSYSQMGLISTANFLGYLLSVALAGMVAERIGARTTTAIGLAFVGASMLMIGHCQEFIQVLSLYALTGLGSGLANVALMGLVPFWFHQRIRGRAAGFMITGNGMAIVFAGLYVPFLTAQLGEQGWRYAWWTMGGMALFVAAAATALLRNTPREKGMEPMGQNDRDQSLPSRPHQGQKTNAGIGLLSYLGLIYALFGATYVVYATFIVTTLVNERGYSEEVAGKFWAIVGALSIFSGPLFGWVSDRLGRKIGMITVFATFTLSYMMVAANLPPQFLYLSIILYGLSAWSIPTIMAAAVGDYMGPSRAAKAFGFITVFFSVGQIIGPAAAGFLADALGTFRIAFWMCAFLTATAAFLSFFLKRQD